MKIFDGIYYAEVEMINTSSGKDETKQCLLSNSILIQKVTLDGSEIAYTVSDVQDAIKNLVKDVAVFKSWKLRYQHLQKITGAEISGVG